MKNYVYQAFLLQCPCTNIDLSRFVWQDIIPLETWKNHDYDLYDWLNQSCIRSIFLSELDFNIDSLDDFRNLLTLMDGIDIPVIINDRPYIPNLLISAYAEITLKAYIWYFADAGITCYVDKIH